MWSVRVDIKKKENAMSDDYTFVLSPGMKTRYSAGSYDVNLRSPNYNIELSVPKHVQAQVEVKQFLLGTPENCMWAWDIHNKSTWPAFVIVKKDGELIKMVK
jgi:hypothetical protein